MKKVLIVLITLSFISPISAGWCRGGFGEPRVPEPRLVRPTSEVVDLTGQETLEFKWWSNVGGYMGNQYFDFRLYSGYQMTKKALILKQKLPPSANHIIVNSNMFHAGQVYTWSLRNVYGAEKSDRSHVSFRVIKK